MALPKATPAQIREQGLKALAKALGPVGMVQFLQQFEMGSGDYALDREEWLNGLTVHDVVEEIKSRRKKQGGGSDAEAQNAPKR